MSDGACRRPASRTLGDLVDEMTTGTPGAAALVFRDERLDYAGLKARVDEFARAFLASASGAETGSPCWSPTERNGLSPPSVPPRSAPSSPRSARSRRRVNSPGLWSIPAPRR